MCRSSTVPAADERQIPDWEGNWIAGASPALLLQGSRARNIGLVYLGLVDRYPPLAALGAREKSSVRWRNPEKLRRDFVDGGYLPEEKKCTDRRWIALLLATQA